jgi:glutamyl-tRNA synthetase
MTVTVRFAPSPTGRLHIGNIRPAIFNALFARRQGGRFLLRIDDTDLERSREDYVEGVREDLTWLGLAWDMEARQSRRFDRYAGAMEKLKAAGRLYPCYESPEEIERRRARRRARGLPPVYDRAALRLTAKDRARLEAEGRRPHWRFLLENRSVQWDDMIRGPQHIDAASLSDPVLIREDGAYLYTLPSVVDDIDFSITHVIRGEDHVANAGVQIQIFEALGAAPPRFAHHNLLVGADGQALSKRLGSLSIHKFRDEGLEPLAVLSHSATIGTSNPVAPHYSLDELAGLFDFAKLSRAPARFDAEELRALNARLLHGLPYEAAADRLAAMGAPAGREGRAFWEAVRPNISLFKDCAEWLEVVQGPVEPVIEDAALCAAARDLLPQEPWDETSWSAWTAAVKGATGARGKALFHPLRLALTGRGRGPELKALLPLIGRRRASARLGGATA